MQIAIKKLKTDAKIPTRGSDYAAGYDLYTSIGSQIKRYIPPHSTAKIGTGIAMAIPNDYFGAIFARSGIATNKGLRPANCVGVIDSDYRGEIIVALHNDTDGTKMIEDGERIAQIVILPYANAEFYETQDLDDTKRGDGGFGSTDEIEGQIHIEEYLNSLLEEARK